jgi:hypothetical protein
MTCHLDHPPGKGIRLRARAEELLRFLRMWIGGRRRGPSPSSVAEEAGKEGVHTSESITASQS